MSLVVKMYNNDNVWLMFGPRLSLLNRWEHKCGVALPGQTESTFALVRAFFTMKLLLIAFDAV